MLAETPDSPRPSKDHWNQLIHRKAFDGRANPYGLVGSVIVTAGIKQVCRPRVLLLVIWLLPHVLLRGEVQQAESPKLSLPRRSSLRLRQHGMPTSRDHVRMVNGNPRAASWNRR